MITHDVLEAVLLADRIAVMRNGRLIANDSPARLLTDPPDEFVGEMMQTPRRQAERLNALIAARC
jgi:osmoprotectant transport system ATP-binding protein